MNKRGERIIVALLFFLALASLASSLRIRFSEPALKPVKVALFERPTEPIELHLRADFRRLSRAPKGEKVKGTLRYTGPDGDEAHEVVLKSRGRSRMTCLLKPLKIKFKTITPPLFAPVGGRLRLFSICRGVDDRTPQAALERALSRELHMYAAIAALSQPAYRAQKVRVIYDDTGSQTRLSATAFIREAPSTMARRYGAALAEPGPLPWPRRVRLLFTERMIRNTDFSIEKGVNLTFLRYPDGTFDAVPHDLDVAVMNIPKSQSLISAHPDWFRDGVHSPGPEKEKVVEVARQLVSKRAAVHEALLGEPEIDLIALSFLGFLDTLIDAPR